MRHDINPSDFTDEIWTEFAATTMKTPKGLCRRKLEVKARGPLWRVVVYET